MQGIEEKLIKIRVYTTKKKGICTTKITIYYRKLTKIIGTANGAKETKVT